MNENLTRFKPREKVDLHPRLFRQLLPVTNKAVIDSGDIGLAYLPFTPKRCVGHFFDATNNRQVTHDLGYVTCRLVIQYRAASFAASDVLEAVAPFEGKGAALYENLHAERCPQGGTTEDSSEADDFEYGSYVIPVQSLMGEKNRC